MRERHAMRARFTSVSIPAVQNGHPQRSSSAARRHAPWMDVDWSAHQSWNVVDGTPVNTIELAPEQASDAQPLVFVHGLSGSWQNWLEQLAVVAAERRVITFDLPGFGYSPMPEQKLSIAGYARLIDQLLAQLGVDAAAVVGNSMGGFIGAELAIAFPQRVERLVLVSAARLSTHEHPRSTRVPATLRHAQPILMPSGAWAATRSDAVARRARLRDAALGVVIRHPDRLPAALAAEQIRGAGKPGFVQGLA